VQEQPVEGPPLLEAAALDAVTKWKYQPNYLNGHAVAINTHVRVTFRLY
jgi:periplasmic protein TonB